MRRILPLLVMAVLFSFTSDAGLFASRMLYERHHGTGGRDVTTQGVIAAFPEAAVNYRPATDQCTELDNPLFNYGIHQQVLNLDQLSKTPEQILREQVYHEAIHRKLNWDRCMDDVFSAFESDQQFMNNWMVSSLRAFVNLKKTMAFKRRCEEVFWYGCDPSFAPLMEANGRYRDYQDQNLACWDFMHEDPDGPPGYDWSDHFDSEEQRDALKEVCFDPRQRRAMAVAPYIFQRSVPFFNSEDVFAAWERNSNLILDDETRQPITDEQLMAMDFTDGFAGDLHMADGWADQMRASLRGVISNARDAGQEDRAMIERMVARANPNDHRDLVRANPAIDPDEYFLQNDLY